MNVISIRFLLGLLALFLCGPSVIRAGDAAPAALVEVRQGRLFIKGQPFTPQSTLADYESTLGKADRFSHLANDIYVYDSLGLLLYQKPGQKVINSLSIVLGPSSLAFAPKKSFQGTILIEGTPIGPDFPRTKWADLRGVKYDPPDPRLAVDRATDQKTVLIMEYLRSPALLDNLGISWER